MGRRILVAEDDPQNMYLVRFLLEKAGYEVLSAGDGEVAVEMARTHKPDLVLMDMLLPRLDGYEATRMLRDDPGPDLPIVALTAYSMKGDREAILEAGCDGYIAKPIDPERFVAEVESYLGEEEA
ncbi:MAG: response regulator [Coriobacteriaceae bacterium]|nr:response regulator [Coriobacteriaceae bacterium]